MAEELIKPDIIDKALKVGTGPDAYIVLEWNRQTRTFFDRGNKPREGARYCLKCKRFNGKLAYFAIERF